MDSKTKGTLKLGDLVRMVHEELLEAERRREESDLPPLFKVDSLDLEVNIIAQEESSVKGGFDLKVISARSTISSSAHEIHKVRLHLKAPNFDQSTWPRDITRSGSRPKILADD